MSKLKSNSDYSSVSWGQYTTAIDKSAGIANAVPIECTPIPEDQLSKIYEPFYRPDISRSRETGGNGLGLYIVKTILHRLELDFSFEPNSSPKGMRFTINF